MTEQPTPEKVRWDADGGEMANLLKDIMWSDGTPIRDSTPIVLDQDDRLYFHADGHGFSFVAVSFFSAAREGDEWASDDFEVERFCRGVACFDGVRHLWMPYVNYPNVDVLAKLMQELAKLEDRFCSSPARKD